jgi:hypothetical protein
MLLCDIYSGICGYENDFGTVLGESIDVGGCATYVEAPTDSPDYNICGGIYGFN